MKKKILISIFYIVAMFVCLTTIVYASTTSSQTAFAMNSSRCGDRGELNATLSKAVSTYSLFGYSSQSFIDPSELLFLSNVLGSSVQLYFCHGDASKFVFDSAGLTTNGINSYETIIWPDSDTTSDILCYSIYKMDWTNKKLITMASCNSAGYSSSLTDSSIANRVALEGANTVVGWHNEFSQESGPDWLDNYHDKLAEGENALVATNYASGKFYAYPDVKDAMVFYWGSPATLSMNEINELPETNNARTETTNILPDKDVNKFNVSQAENIIKSKDESFDLENYEKIVSEGVYAKNMNTGVIKKVESYIDYVLKIGDFITNSAYTVVLDENDNIKAINDNTKKISSNMKKTTNIDSFKLSNEETEYYLNKAKQNISKCEDINKEEIKLYYDIEQDKKYVYVDIEMNNTYDIKNLHYKYEV